MYLVGSTLNPILKMKYKYIGKRRRTKGVREDRWEERVDRVNMRVKRRKKIQGSEKNVHLHETSIKDL